MASRFGPYELIERIGAGGMAEVFLARRAMGGVERRLVIKRILPQLAESPEFVEMFSNEARIAARLEHPNVTQLLDFGQVNGTCYLAMELVDGTTLEQMLQVARSRRRPMPLGPSLKIVSLACEALQYAHGLKDERGAPLGFIHRDVSPDNLLVGYNGAVKLTDFGIAKVASLPSVTRTGILKGKAHYAAPEHIRSQRIDGRADLFALGVVLFQTLTGERPWDDLNPTDTMRRVALEPAPDALALRPDLPEAVRPILARALEKEPARRYPNARAMQADLDALLVAQRLAVSGADIAELVEELVPRVPRAPVTDAMARPAPSWSSQETTAAEDARPAPPGARARAWSDPATTTVDEDPRAREIARAREAAFAAAEVDPTERERALPESRSGLRKVPTWALVAAMAACALAALGVLKLMPHPTRQRAGAAVGDAPGNALVVRANVPTADVFADERLIGKTPLDVENPFPFGRRVTLSVRAVGFEPVDVEVMGGRGTQIDVTFAPPEDEE